MALARIILLLCLAFASLASADSDAKQQMTVSDFLTSQLFPSAARPAAAPAAESKVAVTYKAREKETVVLICPINLGVPDNEQVNLAETKSVDDEDFSSTAPGNSSDLKVSGDDELRETIYEEVQGADESDEPVFNIKLKEPARSDAPKSNGNNSSSSSAIAVIQWFKDSERIGRSARYSPEGAYLKISNVNVKDAGLYECRLVTGYGNKSTNLTLVVSGLSTAESTSQGPAVKPQEAAANSGKPVFLGQDKMKQRRFNKRRGSSLKLRCKARGYPKPDVLWSKDGKPLSEEDYGITRSKWTVELTDLRLDDSGNYTCQVFNKHGSINFTYELNVFSEQETRFSEGFEQENITVLAGMGAVFNCKVKSSGLAGVKWMRQISKAEYDRYIQQTNTNSNGGGGSTETSSAFKLDDDVIRGFYQSSTVAMPFSLIDTDDTKSKITSLDDLENYQFSIRNFMAQSNEDAFNKLNEILKQSLSGQQVRSSVSSKPAESSSRHRFGAPDSIHYITVSPSSSVEQKILYNRDDNYYINQLVLKQTGVKDSGVYVCMVGNSRSGNGHRYYKSYLKVIENSPKNPINTFDLNDLSKTKDYFDRVSKLNPISSAKPSSSSSSYSWFLGSAQSISLLVILIPVLLISLFALVSICYLRRLERREKEPLRSTGLASWLFSCCQSRRRSDGPACCGCFCSPFKLTKKAHPIDDVESQFDRAPEGRFNRQSSCKSTSRSQQYDHSMTNSTMLSANSASKMIFHQKSGASNGAQNSSTLGSSTLSDASSTTATTVAYYATIPLLFDANASSVASSPSPSSGSPPPLPSSQPPSFSSLFAAGKDATPGADSNLQRAISTPSMAYYKIVDCDLVNYNPAVKSECN